MLRCSCGTKVEGQLYREPQGDATGIDGLSVHDGRQRALHDDCFGLGVDGQSVELAGEGRGEDGGVAGEGDVDVDRHELDGRAVEEQTVGRVVVGVGRLTGDV